MRILLTLLIFMLTTSCSDAADKAKTGADMLAMSEKEQTAIIKKLSDELSSDTSKDVKDCISGLTSNANFTTAALVLIKGRSTQPPKDSLDFLFKSKCPAYALEQMGHGNPQISKALEDARRAEEQAKEKLENIDQNALRLPDGRAVFPDQDGNLRLEDGSIVPQEELPRQRNRRR